MPDSVLSESILNSMKQTLWPGEIMDDENNPFDAELILHINAIFTDISRLGIGSDTPFHITGASETWRDFYDRIDMCNNVKEYMHLRLRMVFDPPANSFIVNSFEEMIRKLEWHLTVISDELGDSV